MNKQKSQSGFAHLVIIIILAVALVGTLGFVFYQNVIQKKDTVSKTDESSKNSDNSSKTSIDDKNVTTDPNKGYLVLDDWGVKFKLPSNLGNKHITYYKGIATKGGYLFSTQGVEALGGDCLYKSNSYWMPLVSLSKSTSTPQPDPTVQGFTGYPITNYDGNYYYYQNAQATCSDSDTSLQAQDLALVKELVLSLQKQ